MTKKISRRSFLKLSAGAAASAATIAACTSISYPLDKYEPLVRPPEEVLPGDPTWYASVCRMCPAGCGILVSTVNGRAKKIEGNPEHPLNRGRLCARGQAGLQALYNPDRLQNAVSQTGGRGSRQFESIPWPQVLNMMVEKLGQVSASSVAFLGNLMPDHLDSVVRLWLQAMGAPLPVVFDMLTALEGRTTAYKTSEILFGSSQLPMYDIKNADVVFSFGANLVETWMSPVAQNYAYGEFRQGQTGGRGFFVQFEPRLSATGTVSDEWIPLRPGTSGMVALALGRIIVEEGLGTVGTFGQEMAGLYRGVDVEPLAIASGVEVETLTRLARILASADRPLAVPGGVPAGHTNGLDAYFSIQALNLILRRLGQRGGVYLSPPSPTETMPASPPPSSFEDLRTLIDRMNDGKVELLFVYGANPVYELPPALGFTEALENVPSVISFNPYVDETGVQSDLILPDHVYLEGWGYQVCVPGTDRPAVSGQQPIVQPIYDTRSTVDLILKLSQAMGGEVAEALPWANEALFLQDASGGLFGSSLGSYSARSAGEFWAAWRQYGGWWADIELLFEPEPVGFGNSPLSSSGPTFAGDALEYPYMLQPVTSLSLTDGRGANLPWLQEMPDPMTTARWNTWVEINPETAQVYDLDNNDIVKVISPFGEIEAMVVLFPGIRPDTVAIPTGQGHEDYGRYASGRGSNIFTLLALVSDSDAGALAWGATRVRLEKTGQKHELARLENLDGEGRETLR